MTFADLHRKLHGAPFKPFRIRMVNGSTYDVRQPWMVIAGESSAVVVTASRLDEKGREIAEDWRTLAIDHMMEFSDLPPKGEARRTRRA